MRWSETRAIKRAVWEVAAAEVPTRKVCSPLRPMVRRTPLVDQNASASTYSSSVPLATTSLHE